ncbi:Acetyltransferase [Lachnellula occidentalis]|uniref:Acetyltransferase n=1 Tax=Lachnellula occidentalis TaxID=215460 RepID=A0A8H8RYL8_9HELO|nr:Acetyltransferase [Lachnellula occidentalis]
MDIDYLDHFNGINPFVALLLEVITITLILGFVKPSSIIRLAVLPILVGCIYSILTNAKDYMRLPWAGIFSAQATSLILVYIEIGLLGKWSFEAGGPSSRLPCLNKGTTNGARKEGTSWERLCFGFNSTISNRDVDKPFEVKNTPYFSAKDHDYVPSRANFLVWTVVRFVACYLVLDLVESQPAAPNAGEMFASSSIPIFRRLGEISIEEVFIRIIVCFVFWVMVYSILTCMYSFIAFFAVGSGFSRVAEWRPIFGPLSEAYTIRGFWGKFWHQLTRKMNTGPANFIADDILHLPKGSLIARYTKIFLVFFISGLMHSIYELGGQMSTNPYGPWIFFCTQVIGVLLEDGVQAMYRSLTGTVRSNHPPALWIRIIGYVWVVAFLLFWSTPVWAFPAAEFSKPEGQPFKLTPISVVYRLKGAI